MCARASCPCTVVVPDTCPAAKTNNIKRIYPAASTVKVDPDEFWEVVTTLHFAGAPDAVFVSSVIDRETIAGNGTVGLEIMEQIEDFGSVDAVLVPTGGGEYTIGPYTTSSWAAPAFWSRFAELCVCRGDVVGHRVSHPPRRVQRENIRGGSEHGCSVRCCF
jgi:threonine dehydratase